jgi:hypothetical protein
MPCCDGTCTHVKNQNTSAFRRGAKRLSGHGDEETTGDASVKLIFGLSLENDSSRAQVRQQK